MYAHSTANGRQTADNHAVDPQTFDVMNGRETVICGLCGSLATPWVTDHAAGWVHA